MKQKLIKAAHEVIEEEGLPKAEIIYRQPLNGTRKQFGTCIHKKIEDSYNNKIEDSYKILVYVIKAQYVPDPDGKFKCRKTHKKLRRIMGEERTFDEIANTMAHELAHLKHWRHGKTHKDYTKKILFKILDKMRDKI